MLHSPRTTRTQKRKRVDTIGRQAKNPRHPNQLYLSWNPNCLLTRSGRKHSFSYNKTNSWASGSSNLKNTVTRRRKGGSCCALRAPSCTRQKFSLLPVKKNSFSSNSSSNSNTNLRLTAEMIQATSMQGSYCWSYQRYTPLQQCFLYFFFVKKSLDKILVPQVIEEIR